MQFMKYYKAESVIHSLNPAGKLASSILVSATALLSSQASTQIILAAGVLALVACSRIPAGWFYRQLSFMKILAPIIILLNGFFHAGEIILSVAGYTITVQGILHGLVIALRVINISGIFILYANTTPAAHMAKSLVQLRVPRETAVTLVLSLRNIPLVKRDIDQVMDSMKSRGINFRGLTGFKNVFHMFLPVLDTLLSRAEKQAINMELKRITSAKILDARTSWRAIDSIALLISLAVPPLLLL